ncbi:MAG: chemotaxis protein CheA [Syntrophobacter sp.]
MSSQTFLQDYIEEVQEHLQAMEKSLLILEQQGADNEQISNVFRAAHSLKGASAYMGFEGLANLTHEMETLISEIQVDSRAIPANGISVLLECVDLISNAVDYVRKEGTEPALDDSVVEHLRSAFVTGTKAAGTPEDASGKGDSILKGVHDLDLLEDFLLDSAREEAAATPSTVSEDPDVSPIQEEDEELLSIFVSSFRENYSNLTALLKSSPSSSITEEELTAANGFVDKLISSAQYMDYHSIVAILAEWKESLGGTNGNHGRVEIIESLQRCGARLDRMIPGLGVCSQTGAPQPDMQDPIDEEDEELLSIFLDSFQQNFASLAGLIASPEPSREDLAKASELTESLIQSSRYMDYEEIVVVLEEWESTLAGVIGGEGGDGNELPGAFAELHANLSRKLTGLKTLDLGNARFATGTPDVSPDVPDSPGPVPINVCTDVPECVPFLLDEQHEEEHPDSLAKDLVLPPGEVKPEPPVQASRPKDVEAQEKKDRAVLYPEDVSQSAVTLRVDAQKVDQLLNQVGELVVTRSEFIQTATLFRDVLRDLTTRGILPKSELRQLRLLGFRLNESTQSLGRVTNDLQSSVMRVRMLPIIQLFERFPRIVRDQARKLGKKVELVIEGGDTEIDKRVLERMYDPLVQFIRNALVHGLESPQDRVLGGKPETGTIRLSAYHSGDYVTVEVQDDGRGINIPKLREMLRNRKEVSQHELDMLTDEEVAYSIFMPGISTYEKVDGSAGRGVGLDVVKENVENMNGAVEVVSSAGEGTLFIIRIPLTVAIIRALLVREADQIFTLPLSSVSEILRYRPEDTHSIEGFPVITLRGKTVALVNLRSLLNLGRDLPESKHKFIVIVSTSFREVGLVVDGLMGEREVVIKSIDNSFNPVEGFSGATILGDGRVSLIIDVSAMLKMMKTAFAGRQGIQFSQPVH